MPCGEYLYDHRNSTLREYLLNEVVLGKTGLGSKFVDGFYFDDAWSDKNTPGGGALSCNHSPIGGATEENPFCAVDAGLTQADTTAMVGALSETMRQVRPIVLSFS